MSTEAHVHFEQLWSEHGRAVLRYAQRRVADEDVDDVVSEVFVVAWRRIEEVPAFALPWLLTVARGVAANARRAQRRRLALGLRLAEREVAHHRDPDRSAPSPPTSSPAGAGDGALHAALAQLSESDREALTLIAWEDLSRVEAAQALGCTRAALAVRLHRARRRLKTALETPAIPSPATGPPPQTPARGPAAPGLGRPAPAPSSSSPLSPSCPGGTR